MTRTHASSSLRRVTLVDCTFDKVLSNQTPTKNISELQLVNVVIAGKQIGDGSA